MQRVRVLIVWLRCERKWDACGLEALTFTPHLGSQLPVADRSPDQNSRQLPAKYFAEDGVRLQFSIIIA